MAICAVSRDRAFSPNHDAIGGPGGGTPERTRSKSEARSLHSTGNLHDAFEIVLDRFFCGQQFGIDRV